MMVYMAGPITARDGFTVEQNVKASVDIYIRLVRAGVIAFCPHLSAAFPEALDEVDYEVWMAYDFAIIDRATHVLMLPRWETSAGARREHEYARLLGKTIIYNYEELL